MKVAVTSEQIVSEEKSSSVSNEPNSSAEGTSAPAKKCLTDLYEELENIELAWQETRTKARNLLLHPFTPSTALRHPRELLLYNFEGRLVCEKSNGSTR